MTFNTMRLVAYKLALAIALSSQAAAMGQPVSLIQQQINQLNDRITDLTQQIANAAHQGAEQAVLTRLRAARNAAEAELDACLLLRRNRNICAGEIDMAVEAVWTGEHQASLNALQRQITQFHDQPPQLGFQAIAARDEARRLINTILASQVPLTLALLTSTARIIGNQCQIEDAAVRRINEQDEADRQAALVQELETDRATLNAQVAAISAVLSAITRRAAEVAPAAEAIAVAVAPAPAA